MDDPLVTRAKHLGLDQAGRPTNKVRVPRSVKLLLALVLAVGLSAFLLHSNRPVALVSDVPDVANVARRLPPPDRLRPLAPKEAMELNAQRPVTATPGDPAPSFRVKGEDISRLRAIECLTQAIYYEAASEGVDGGRAVAQVVLNRVRHPAYPNNVCGVVYQGSERVTGCQFTFTCDGSLARTPMAYLWARSRKIATEALFGRVFSGVGLSTHYHADYVLPYWADSLDKTAVIGRHIFYRFRGAAGSRQAFAQRYAGQEVVPQVAAPSEVIEQSLEAAVLPPPDDSATAAIVVAEDEIEALAPARTPDVAPSSSLQADLARGELILGEPESPARSKASEQAQSLCASPGTKRLEPVGSTVTRVGAQTARC